MGKLALAHVFCLVLIVGGARVAPLGAALGACHPPSKSSQVPALTNAQCVEASKIVGSDSGLRQLLAGHRSVMPKPNPWGSENGTTVIGAVFRIALSPPLSAKLAVLPTASFPASGVGTYSRGKKAVALRDATSLLVFVDLRYRAVVSIVPQPAGSEQPPPGSTSPSTIPGYGGN